jgi:hypothetical protein
MANNKLYFGKVSIQNDEIYKIYDKKEGEERLLRVFDKIHDYLEDGIEYVKEWEYTSDDGETIDVEPLRYQLKIIKKNPNSIIGSIHKTSPIWLNEETSNGKIEKVKRFNVSISNFYYDISAEIIAYERKDRFGYIEFLNAFKEMLNYCMVPLPFDVSLIKEGLSIGEIKKQLDMLSTKSPITEIIIHLKPPNPNTQLLKSIHNEQSVLVEQFNAGNLTEVSYVFRSSGLSGLKPNAPIISERIDMIEQFDVTLNSQYSTSVDYATVYARTAEGGLFSTDDAKPKTVNINVFDEIKDVASNAINKILSASFGKKRS